MNRRQWLKSIIGSPVEQELLDYDKKLRAGEIKVEVYKTDETGEVQWAICMQDTVFWMDAFKTKKEALALCKTMGWPTI